MWLSGIKVIDFTTLLPGPFATLRLADLGADIIKVEPPGGDGARHAGIKVDGIGVVFLANHRNKRSLILDLKTDIGQADALALIRQADVVIEGFRPGVMKKFGLDYEAARQVKPDIIYCSLTGYGQTGDLAASAGHDLNYVALSGMLSQITDDTQRPVIPSVQLADTIGGMAASEAILAALVQRDRTGEGARLDVCIVDAATGLLTYQALIAQAIGYERGLAELNGKYVCYHLYQTSDHRFVSLAALEPKFWHLFCTATGHTEWLPDQFAEATDGHAVFEALKSFFQTRTLVQWRIFGREVDCCLQPVLNMTEVLAGPHATARHSRLPMDPPSQSTLVFLDTHAGGYKPDTSKPQA